MSSEKKSAGVYYGSRLAGILKKNAAGYVFAYDGDYLKIPGAMPISLSLPLSPTQYESSQLFPFFEGLLPEGWLLDITSAVAKIDKTDQFSLLLHIGRDPIGAVSIQPIEEFS